MSQQGHTVDIPGIKHISYYIFVCLQINIAIMSSKVVGEQPLVHIHYYFIKFAVANLM